MDNYINQFLESLKLEDKSIHTIRNYKNDLKLFIAWLSRSTSSMRNTQSIIQPSDITFPDIKAYRNYLVKKLKQKPNSINRKLASISKFCKWCVKQKFLATNPAEQVKGLRKPNLSPKSLDNSKLHKFLRMVYKFNNKRDIAICELLTNTGIRVGELCALTLSDITITERKGEVIIRYGKGRSSRTVPLNKDARNTINVYLAERPKLEDDHLFIGQRKNGLKESAVWRVISKYAKFSGLHLSPHTLRHTFGRRLVKEPGVDIVTVQAAMGHRNLNTTAIYTQPSQEDVEKALDKLIK